MSGIVWDERGDAGERVLSAKLGAYSARIVEGRVWRWQVIDDVEDARDLKVCEMGRCDSLEEARERAETKLRRVAGELWTVWIDYEQPSCGCLSCKEHPTRRSGITLSVRGMDEAEVMAKGVQIARGKGYGAPVATHARKMGVVT